MVKIKERFNSKKTMIKESLVNDNYSWGDIALIASEYYDTGCTNDEIRADLQDCEDSSYINRLIEYVNTIREVMEDEHRLASYEIAKCLKYYRESDIWDMFYNKLSDSRIEGIIECIGELNENVKMRNRNIKTRITENSDLYGFKFSGYGFKTRSMHTALIDLWCFKDKRTCLKYYNGLKDIVDYFEDSDISDNEVDDYNIMYQNDMQSFFESCQENAVAYYEEIDWRHDIESYKGQDVYLDKFNDKYYKIISDHTIDIYG